MSFKQFNFDPKITAGINACKYESPTPIQEQTIPAIISGKDMLGLAQTGTGKTAAFVLPILQQLVGKKGRQVRSLIVAPTRELAEQIHEEIGKLASATNIKSIAVYGGVNKNPQIKKLKAGVQIVVACPGRLLDLLSDQALSLANVEHLVLDEADHMFDMGFIKDIVRILKHLPKKRQTLLFSATMPKEIRHLADDILTDPAFVQIGIKKPAETVSHAMYSVEQPGKLSLLKHLMAETDMSSTLIFTRTKYKAKQLGQKLDKAGYNATSIQGNLSQAQRQRAMQGFKSGKFKIMVATDIAARGIDVSGISHVINFDMPDTVEAYTHRIGRTGRAACTGEALSFVGREDMKMVRSIEQALGKEMDRLSPGEDYVPPKVDPNKAPAKPRGARPRKTSSRPNKSRRRTSQTAGKSVFGLKNSRRSGKAATKK